MEFDLANMLISMLNMTIRMATPLTLGALSGIMCERSGVVNIAIEGIMLTAAYNAFVVAIATQNLGAGLAAALITGIVLSFLHAVLCIQFKVDQIISGAMLNILAVGVTGYLNRLMFFEQAATRAGTFPSIEIPLLSEIPFLGEVLFKHQPLVYAMLALVVVVHLILFHTPWGLRTRAVGEHPRAADTLGVNVYLVRYVNVMAGGILAGLGGAFFTLESVGHFEPLMTNGRGFIALAAEIFGKWTPLGALGASLLFGAAEALQINLQILKVGIPYQFVGMLPYVLTMIVLAGVIGRAIPPAALGMPYTKE